MGKSTSCFKIIACGGDSSDKDDIDIPEVCMYLIGSYFRVLPFHLLSLPFSFLFSFLLFFNVELAFITPIKSLIAGTEQCTCSSSLLSKKCLMFREFVLLDDLLCFSLIK